eukprot:gnl/Hemi2/24222_TR8129_c0_g1_i1.p2 gnl/Hemi2/24222_TR8129_c0_g1~~gnl/Hemi2/24222_TR8129_c0_g1_i1.p2  ORF type:complete len:217 (-),score=60.39 gnl/Hemi2/24222_TR8129_c0_g1_i1:212-862(-)
MVEVPAEETRFGGMPLRAVPPTGSPSASASPPLPADQPRPHNEHALRDRVLFCSCVLPFLLLVLLPVLLVMSLCKAFVASHKLLCCWARDGWTLSANELCRNVCYLELGSQKSSDCRWCCLFPPCDAWQQKSCYGSFMTYGGRVLYVLFFAILLAAPIAAMLPCLLVAQAVFYCRCAVRTLQVAGWRQVLVQTLLLAIYTGEYVARLDVSKTVAGV